MEKIICWVTPDSFLDTDIYIMRYLPDYFHIKWFIIKRNNTKLDYQNLLSEISEKPEIEIKILEKCASHNIISNLKFYYVLQQKLQLGDIVYQPVSLPFILPMVFLKGHRNRTIVPIHNVNTPKGGSHYLMNKISTNITIKYFLNFITFSQSQYKLLSSLTHKKNILYAPFMLKDYGPSTKKRENELITFMNFGNIREYKRIDVLIDAAQLAYEKTKIKFRVLIAGKCENWNFYQGRIKYPELFDLRISRVEDTDLPNLFEESDYFVAPYQDIAQSGSLIVGINYNKPIIASRIEAFEEYVDDGISGYLMKPADVEDLANIIIKILKNHALVYSKLKDGQKTMISKKFNDVVITKKYVEYLNSI